MFWRVASSGSGWIGAMATELGCAVQRIKGKARRYPASVIVTVNVCSNGM